MPFMMVGSPLAKGFTIVHAIETYNPTFMDTSGEALNNMEWQETVIIVRLQSTEELYL